MNFMFFFIVFANFNFLKYSALEKNDILKWNNKYEPNYEVNMNLIERSIKNRRKRIKRQQFSKAITNDTTMFTTTNLKFNIFDKMLSEEMLSLKQHFYEKDSKHSTSSLEVTLKSNVATPTLEIKQKWPIKGLLFKSFGNIGNKSEPSDNVKNILRHETSYHIDHSYENTFESQVKDKVVGLRSLSDAEAIKVCSCMKTNPLPTCTHLCTGINSEHKNDDCTHTTQHQCTRRAKTKSPYTSYSFYITYPYFWSTSTYTMNPYYHSKPINEIKISKTKRRRKHKKPHTLIEENYYEEKLQDKEIYYGDKKESYANSYDELYYDTFFDDKSTKVPNLINIEDNENSKKLHYVNKDAFVNDVVEDLKNHYSDVVLKDCYCSSSGNIVINIVFISVTVVYGHICCLILN